MLKGLNGASFRAGNFFLIRVRDSTSVTSSKIWSLRQRSTSPDCASRRHRPAGLLFRACSLEEEHAIKDHKDVHARLPGHCCLFLLAYISSREVAKRSVNSPWGTSPSDSRKCFSSTKSATAIRPSRNRSSKWLSIPGGGGRRILGICELPVKDYMLDLLG